MSFLAKIGAFILDRVLIKAGEYLSKFVKQKIEEIQTKSEERAKEAKVKSNADEIRSLEAQIAEVNLKLKTSIDDFEKKELADQLSALDSKLTKMEKAQREQIIRNDSNRTGL